MGDRGPAPPGARDRAADNLGREVIAAGAAWGDRFDATVGTPRAAGWFPVAELFGPELPAVLGAVGVARGTDRPAVSGALLFEQYAQRLVAPALAALYHHGFALDARLPAVSARIVDGAVRRLAFAAPPQPVTDGAAGRNRTVEVLLAENLDVAAVAVHRLTRVGRRVLRGAVANAVAGSFLQMSWPHDDHARHVDDARALLDRVPGLAELVTVRPVTVAGRSWMYYARTSCCLAFRTAVNRRRSLRYCSSCPVLPAATTAELFVRAIEAFSSRSGSGSCGA